MILEQSLYPQEALARGIAEQRGDTGLRVGTVSNITVGSAVQGGILSGPEDLARAGSVSRVVQLRAMGVEKARLTVSAVFTEIGAGSIEVKTEQSPDGVSFEMPKVEPLGIHSTLFARSVELTGPYVRVTITNNTSVVAQSLAATLSPVGG